MMEVIIRIVDDSRIELFKPMFGKGMITAWAKIHGKCNNCSHYVRYLLS